MLMASIALSKEFLDHFKISSYKAVQTPSAQKLVYYVTIDEVKYALKLIRVKDIRIDREVEICKKFTDNEGIPKIIWLDKFEGETVILEEYIDGKDLSAVYDTYKGDETKICTLLSSICNILNPVWEENYVHRDLKFQNIRIKSDGSPVVLDFGIARALNESTVTDTGFQPHSLHFASPEQLDGKKDLVSYRTDFFCLGIIGYYLYTSQLPFGDTQDQITAKFNTKDLSINMTNEVLKKFCNAVFKHNPSERPRSSEILIKILGK